MSTIRLLASAPVNRFVVVGIILIARTGAALEPEEQLEKHWVDNRWSQTVLGPFQASTIETPNGVIAKALSIKIGDHEEAAVCYDTMLGNLRAAWTGGFLRFDAARYGLLNKPSIAGPIRFLAPAKEAWRDPATYRGLEIRGSRIVLRWQVGERDVRESPWIESGDDLTVFTRTFWLAPGNHSQRLEIVAGTDAPGAVEVIEGITVAHRDAGKMTTAIAATGAAHAFLSSRPSGGTSVEFTSAAKDQTAKIFIWFGPISRLPNFVRLVKASGEPERLETLPRAAPRWNQLTTHGTLGGGSAPWRIDTLTAPYDNPWKALLFFSGIDFLENGDAVACTIHGDVWRISGVDEKLERLTWRRFATGLFQPLGLRVVDGCIYVLGRDRITELRDRNEDGEADEYENFSDLIATSTGGHDYVTNLEADDSGNFYYVDPRGVHRISPDGHQEETIATGWRNPNGMSVGPDRTITVAPQEGNWTPASHIDEVRPGGYYGFGGPRISPERPVGYDLPLCWIPRAIDNSSGSQVWVTSDRWGPLRGQLLNLSFGRCTMQLVLREKVDGQPQGGVVPLPGRFISGVMRGTFNRHDGQLYVAGSQGWQTAATRDGCLQRVQYTGAKAYLPIALEAHANGLKITFTESLDRATAEDPGSYDVEQWCYEYSERYGSKEFSVANPRRAGHDSVAIKSVRLLPDNRSVFLEIPQLQPVMQMHVQWNINAVDGAVVRGEIFNTIHKLRAAL